MKFNRASHVRRFEADLLNEALESFLWSPPTDKFRRISSSQIEKMKKVDYSPEFTLHCITRVRKNLFEEVGIKSMLEENHSLGGKTYRAPEFPRIDFK